MVERAVEPISERECLEEHGKEIKLPAFQSMLGLCFDNQSIPKIIG